MHALHSNIHCLPLFHTTTNLSTYAMPSFAADNTLDLLFEPSLIPTEVRDVLAEGLHVSITTRFSHSRVNHPIRVQIRPLSSTDDARGLFPVLSTLSPSPTPASDEYAAHFQQLKRFPGSYFAIVIIDKSNDQVVGTGTVFMERKLIRNLGTYPSHHDMTTFSYNICHLQESWGTLKISSSLLRCRAKSWACVSSTP